MPAIWEVISSTSGAIICGRGMKLTKAQAQNKVDNDARFGHPMEIRRAGPAPKPFDATIYDVEDD